MRRSEAKIVALIITVLITVFLLMTSSIAIVKGEQSYSFTGGGHGHGVGMSMAGVNRLAKSGRDYPAIIKYYYRGVSIGRRTGLPSYIRAGVYSTNSSLSFSANNHFRVYSSNGKYLRTITNGDILYVKYKNRRYYLSVKRKGRTVWSNNYPISVLIKPWRSSYLRLGNNNRIYRGNFYARSVGSSSIWAINKLPLTTYLKGLGEEPESWPINGLRTLAVTSRTYAADKVLKRKKHYDIVQSQQYYVGIRKAPRLAYAVDSTRGSVITYKGKLILAAYSASSGGYEADFRTIWGGKGYPYLRARKDTWSRGTKNYRWGPIKFSRSRLQSILRKRGVNIGTLRDIKFSKRGADRRPSKVTVVGNRGSKVLWAQSQFASWLGLKSSLIWLKKGNNNGISVNASAKTVRPGQSVRINGGIKAAKSGTLALRDKRGSLERKTLKSIKTGGSTYSVPTIVVDPGHGGRQHGAIGPNGLSEKTANLKVALRLRHYLQAAGARVVMTRTGDKALSLKQRVLIARRAKADRFVSIHHNSSRNRSINGTETYSKRGSSKTSLDMSRKVQSSMLKHLKLKNRHAKRANFYVLKYSKIVAILTEASFISNRTQASRLRSASHIDREAKAIFYGLKAHMSFKRIYAPLSIQGASAPASSIYFPHVIDTSGYWRSLVSVKNTSLTDTQATISFYDDAGNIEKTLLVSIKAGAAYSFYPKSKTGKSFSGNIKVSSSGSSLVGQVSQVSKGDGTIAGSQGIGGSKEQYVPKIVDNSAWSSFVAIKNTESTSGTATIKFYNTSGSLAKTQSVTIGANAKHVIYPKVSMGSNFEGSIDIESTTDVASYVSRINSKKRRLGLVPTSQKSSVLYFAQAPENSAWRSYLSVKNTSDSTQSITISALKPDGSSIGQKVISVASKAVYDTRVSSIAGSRFNGSIKVSASSSVVAAYLTQTDKYNKALALMEGQTNLSSVNFANVDDGGTAWSSEVAFTANGSSPKYDISLLTSGATVLGTKSLTVNNDGCYRFYPWKIISKKFGGSVSITSATGQATGYLAQSK